MPGSRRRAWKRIAVQSSLAALAIAAVLYQTPNSFSADIAGTAGKVVDGDTLWVCDRSACTKVRLCGMDAPELNDPGGAGAKVALASLIGEKTIRCIPVGQGTVCDGRSRPTSYDRIVAQCFVGGKDIAAAMVDAGQACDWTEFSGGAYSHSGQARCQP